MLILFPGWDYDYQTLNLTFAANVMKIGFFIGLFLKPLKRCVAPSIRVPVSLSTL
jgi:hypothetical protein